MKEEGRRKVEEGRRYRNEKVKEEGLQGEESTGRRKVEEGERLMKEKGWERDRLRRKEKEGRR